MVVTPTFHADMDALKRTLRLSSLDAQQDADAQLDQAVKEARVRFNTELGLARVTTVAAYTVSDNPSTTEESLRALAEVTETRIVKSLLSESMPIAFLDATPAAQQMFNDEPAFREATTADLRSMRRGLELQIAEAMSQLAQTSLARPAVVFEALAPATTPTAPGETIHTTS